MEVSGNQGLGPGGVNSYSGIGAELKYLREEQGHSLAEVARALKINGRYLVAIEEGSFQDLPGAAYVGGFLRSYASFLGIDPRLVVQKFKSEPAYENVSKLDFPVPVRETNIPRIPVVWGSLVLAVVIVCGWYFIQESRKVKFDDITRVPEEFSKVVTTDDGEATINFVEDAKIRLEQKVAEKPTEGLEVIAVEDTEFELEPSDKAVATGETDFTSLESVIVQTGDTFEGEEGGANTVPAPPPLPTESSGKKEPHVYGMENLASRITLVAFQDSWVQVEGLDRELLITRILYVGDSYRVPDRPGLTLITGNAGGLKVIVDDKEAPPLGPLGAVRRGILLDAERLLEMVSATPG
jgi:cytoskeleton protein RodZ